MGRPSKLTPERHKKIVKLIEAGNYPETAAGACGVNRATYYVWMAKGREAKSGKYKDFHDDVQRAREAAEAELIQTIRRASVDDWRAASWMLERTRKGKYSKPIHVEAESISTIKIEGAPWLAEQAKADADED
jgi:hypothetical protein